MRATDETCPYVGLRPFARQQRRYFFGRERELRVVFSNLSAAPLTVLYGPSGTGKSSLLNAGLIPLSRVENRRTGIVCFSQWSSPAFLDELKKCCIEEARRVARVKTFSVDAAMPLDELITALAAHLTQPLLIVLDQFEEYLFYHPETGPRHRFEDELSRAITHGQDEALFLIALREDALSRLDRFRASVPHLLANTLRLQALNRTGAEDAIRKPLPEFQRRHPEQGGPASIEDALVHEVLDQVCMVDAARLSGEQVLNTRQSAEEVNASILQLVMTRIWEAECADMSPVLRLSTLNKLGGAEKIVATHFDRVMQQFTAEERAVCGSIFPFLVRSSGGKEAFSPEDLAGFAKQGVNPVRAVLGKLVQNGVLRRITAPETYELLHDILGPAVLGWRGRYEREREVEARLRRLVWWGVGVVGCLLCLFAAIQYQRTASWRLEVARLIAAQFQKAAQQAPSGSDDAIKHLLRARAILRHSHLSDTDVEAALERGVSQLHVSGVDNFAFVAPGSSTELLVLNDDGWAQGWSLKSRDRMWREKLPLRRVDALSPDATHIVGANSAGRQAWVGVKPDANPMLSIPQELNVKPDLRAAAIGPGGGHLVLERGSKLEACEKLSVANLRTLPKDLEASGFSGRPGKAQGIFRCGRVAKLVDFGEKYSAVRTFGLPGEEVTAWTFSNDGKLVIYALKSGELCLGRVLKLVS